MLTARDVMKTGVTSARPHQSAYEVARSLVKHGISGTVVVDEFEAPVGVVSITDLLGHLAGLERDHPARSLADLGEPPSEKARRTSRTFRESRPISQIMTSFVVRVDESTPLPEVIALMVQTSIHRVFVTREGKLTGVVSSLDLTRLLGRVLESQELPHVLASPAEGLF